jgi:predicted nucleic acid-binding protein
LTSRRIVQTDACVLLNLAMAGRLDLCGSLVELEFRVPDEVLAEILSPSERRSVEEALGAGILCHAAMAEPEALALFADLRQFLGIGESACLALAAQGGGLVASDEKRRFLREAETRLGPGRVLNTAGLFLLGIRRGALTVDEADEAKAVLERQRFRMPFASFRDLI